MSRNPRIYEPCVRLYEPTDSFKSYRIVWYDPPDSRARQHRHSTSRKREAEAIRVAKQVARELIQGVSTSNADTLVCEVAKEWADPDAHSWKPKYRDKLLGCYDNFLAEPLGNLRCRDLSPVVFRRVLVKMEKADYSDSYIQDVGSTMRNLVSFMQAEGYVQSDPMTGVSYSMQSSEAGESVHLVSKSEIPTGQQVIDVSNAMAARTDVWWRYLQPMIGAWSGLRRGEMLALQAQHVKLDDHTIRVARALVQPDGKPAYVDEPRHGKKRWTIFPEFLREQLSRRVAEVLKAEGPEGLMFPAPEGGWDLNFGTRRYRPAALACDFPVRTDVKTNLLRHPYHSMRHFFCTTALLSQADGGMGLPVAEVAMLVGHASADFTMRRYVGSRQNALQMASSIAASMTDLSAVT